LWCLAWDIRESWTKCPAPWRRQLITRNVKTGLSLSRVILNSAGCGFVLEGLQILLKRDPGIGATQGRFARAAKIKKRQSRILNGAWGHVRYDHASGCGVGPRIHDWPCHSRPRRQKNSRPAASTPEKSFLVEHLWKGPWIPLSGWLCVFRRGLLKLIRKTRKMGGRGVYAGKQKKKIEKIWQRFGCGPMWQRGNSGWPWPGIRAAGVNQMDMFRRGKDTEDCAPREHTPR